MSVYVIFTCEVASMETAHEKELQEALEEQAGAYREACYSSDES